MNVMRCVEELENAGVAALSIEDTELPALAGAGGKPSLISIEEGVGKMKAALAARRDPGLCILGRTSAAAMTTAADAAQRVQAYEAAGVDALFVVGVKDADAMQTIASATTLPIVLGSAGPQLQDREILKDYRVKIALQGHQPFAAAVQAIYDTMKSLREGQDPKSLPRLAPAELMSELTQSDQYKAWSSQFLDGEKPGAGG
jgi:carboxyvinyl-carboxyphosphonate phosphorylmutase